MMSRAPMQSIALVIFFTFCQVIGTMCAFPALSAAEDPAILVDERMACPMDASVMCPPSATSSPERQVKTGGAIDVDHAPIWLSPAAVLPVPSGPTLWSRSSVLSIVPISIESSSVLRI